jgi:zinc and cadmium transporter
MDEIFIVIFFSLIGGLFSLIGGVILLKRKEITDNFINYVTPFAAGALLAAVFMDLLPEGVHQENGDAVFLAALIGILGFFLAERFLRWFHHHHEDDEGTDPSAKLIIVGDIAHNALDGVAIAAAFLVSVPTGIVTTVAVAAHEIPQEIGDFGLLLSRGMKRRKVLIVNVLSALATTLAAVITYALGSDNRLPISVLLGISAGFLLYIALSDVIPTIHQRADKSKLLQWQTVMLLIGVIVVSFAVSLAHSYIEAGNSHDHPISDTVEPDYSEHNHKR